MEEKWGEKTQSKHSWLGLCGQQWSIPLLKQIFVFTLWFKVNNHPNIVDTQVRGHPGKLLCRLRGLSSNFLGKCWLECERPSPVETSVTRLRSDWSKSKSILVHAWQWEPTSQIKTSRSQKNVDATLTERNKSTTFAHFKQFFLVLLAQLKVDLVSRLRTGITCSKFVSLWSMEPSKLPTILPSV